MHILRVATDFLETPAQEDDFPSLDVALILARATDASCSWRYY